MLSSLYICEAIKVSLINHGRYYLLKSTKYSHVTILSQSVIQRPICSLISFSASSAPEMRIVNIATPYRGVAWNILNSSSPMIPPPDDIYCQPTKLEKECLSNKG